MIISEKPWNLAADTAGFRGFFDYSLKVCLKMDHAVISVTL